MRVKEQKSFQLEMKDMNDATGEVAFYFGAFTKDQDGDIILKTAYNKTVKENFAHIYHNIDHHKAVGCPKSIGVDNVGAFCVSQLALKTVDGMDCYEKYKGGLIKGHSQEFETLSDMQDTTLKARVIKELKLWGVTSVTNIPANLDTPTISLKSYEDAVSQMKKINNILHKGNISDQLGKEFVAEYLVLKSFIDENKELLKSAGITYCSGCDKLLGADDMKDNKCNGCGKFVNAQKSLITEDFIKKVKLF